MARTKFCELRDAVVAKPGAAERLAGLRADTLDEIRLYELRHGEAISQAELAGRLDVTQGAISKLEHSDDVRVSTLRQYLEALGARLELVAVFDEANLALVKVEPELNLYDEAWPIWTHQEQLPPAKFVFDDDDRRVPIHLGRDDAA